MNQKIKILSIICGILQIAGLILIISQSFLSNSSAVWVLIGVSGFAGVVQFFLPYSIGSSIARLAALSGVGIIIFAMLKV